MYEDQQDMFRDMDELFALLYAQIIRNFGSERPQAFGYRLVIQGGGENPRVPDLPHAPLQMRSEPGVEVHRIGNDVKVITGLPGATMDAIRLDIKGALLTIDADTGCNHFHTTVALPRVYPGSMQTSFKNGVLEATFKILADTSEKE